MRRDPRGFGARDLHRRCDQERVGDCAAGVGAVRGRADRGFDYIVDVSVGTLCFERSDRFSA